MKQCTTCKEFFDLNYFYLRQGKPRSQCKGCHYKTTRRNAVKNKETCYARTREWRKSAGEQIKNHMAEKYRKNPELYREKSKVWRRANPVKMLQQRLQRAETERKATVSWADEDRMREIYQRAGRISMCTGFKWHVDHVIPLQHKLVCGLHVPDNLQVIPEKLNLRKHNCWSPT